MIIAGGRSSRLLERKSSLTAGRYALTILSRSSSLAPGGVLTAGTTLAIYPICMAQETQAKEAGALMIGKN